MEAAKKIILALALVVMAVANASAFIPNAPENRVWEKSETALQSLQSFPSQLPASHQQNPSPNYDVASACCLAAEGGFTTLYHGTSSEAAAAIRANGIDLSFSRANLDFGKGFYTTKDLAQAQSWAARQGGEVLTFRVPNAQLNQLNQLHFPSANTAWTDFVAANRGGAPLHSLDAVSGPMLGNPRAFLNGASPRSFGQQMSFHSDAAIDLLNNSLLP